jgi:beta-glucanase (GH16 family)
MGIEPNQVQSNYYGKGPDGTSVRGAKHPLSTIQTEFHTYAVNWTTTSLTFFIDGAAVRTVKAADAKDKYPQTPLRLKIGIWCTGTPDRQPGDIAWGGGLTDFSKGPFKMVVESIRILNYSPASQYRYTDNSGSWQSIEVIGGQAGGAGDDKQDAASSSSGTPGSVSNSASGNPTSITVPSASGTTAPVSSGTGTSSSPSGSAAKTTDSTPKPTANSKSVGSLVIPPLSAFCIVFISFLM